MKVLIASGGTTRKIGSARGITNHTTGSSRKYIAGMFLESGHKMTLVATKGAVKPQKQPHLTTYIVSNIDNLVETLGPSAGTHDVFIHSVAASDYTLVYMTDLDKVEDAEHVSDSLTQQDTESKVLSKTDYQVLLLEKTPKATSLVKTWNPDIMLIGFRLLTNVSRDELFAVTRASLKKDKAHYIVVSDLNEISGAQHHACLLNENDTTEVETRTEPAKSILERVTNHD